jgi:hypothetical protein
MLIFDDSDDEAPSPLSPCFPVIEVTSERQKEQPDLATEVVDTI